MSMNLWGFLRWSITVHGTLSARGRGLLRTTNPVKSGVPAMRACGTATILRFFNADKIMQIITVRVVYKLCYELIVGASFSPPYQGIFGFDPCRGLKPKPSAARVPFSDDNPWADRRSPL